MNSEEYLKKDITITREERLSRDGKSLLFCYQYSTHRHIYYKRAISSMYYRHELQARASGGVKNRILN